MKKKIINSLTFLKKKVNNRLLKDNNRTYTSLEKTSQKTLWPSDSYYPPFSNVSGDIPTGAAYQGIFFVAVVIYLLISFESEVSSRTEQKWYR